MAKPPSCMQFYKNQVSSIALWIWLFDLLALSDILFITAYLLHIYAANAKTLGGEVNLLEYAFGAGSFFLGLSVAFWGLTPSTLVIAAHHLADYKYKGLR